MSRPTQSPTLPAELAELLDGTHVGERTDQVFELLTVSDAGWPHIALLSVGEVVTLDEDTLGLALWPTSTTSDNLRRSGRGVLQLYHDGAAYRVRLAVRALGDEEAPGGRLALFAAKVERVVRDAVNYARLSSGPTIELADSERVLARWRTQLETLRRAAGGTG